jgi:SAM-dependent methyltransferase
MPNQLPEHLKRMQLSWNDKSCVMLTDNKAVFRYIFTDYAEKVRALFNSGLIDVLVKKGILQPGELRETGIADYPLVIEHQIIPRISYPFEWPALALKEAALTILEIEETANRYGYTLYDPNPFNVTVQKGHPVYLDYGSFIPIAGTPIWSGYDKAFRDYILFPLKLFERKLHYVARLVLRDIVGNDLDKSTRVLAGRMVERSMLDKLIIVITHRGEITSEKLIYRLGIASVNKILSNSLLKKLLEGATYKLRPAIKDKRTEDIPQVTDTRHLKDLGSRAKFLKRLRREVASLKVSEGESLWSEYYKNIVGTKPPWERDVASWTEKERSVQEIINKLKPETALDIGANTGWFSLMLAYNGASVVSIDRDEESINNLYKYVGREKLDVLPLIMDIRQPTPEYELNIGTVSKAADRFKCELVMVLGIIHHMVHNQGVSLEHLVHMLGGLTSKYLLIEFAPLDDAWAKMPDFTENTWSFEVIKRVFSKDYDFQGSWESYPQGRKLMLFRKLNSE